MHIFKIHYKILSGKNLKDHVYIIKASTYGNAMNAFDSFIESNLNHGNKVFGTPSITEIPDNITRIYSSYI